MDQLAPKNPVAALCDTLGRRRIADRLGVRTTAVGNAAVDGRFPARWYVEIKAMCEDDGLAAPGLDLFSFARASEPQETAA